MREHIVKLTMPVEIDKVKRNSLNYDEQDRKHKYRKISKHYLVKKDSRTSFIH